MSHHSKITDKTVAIFIALVMVCMSLVAIPVYAASKKSSNPKSKSSSKSKAKTTSKCDRNYSACVPIASDVDCKPGKGNGPKYTTGPKKVLKKDIYKLDNDHDRIACEKN